MENCVHNGHIIGNVSVIIYDWNPFDKCKIHGWSKHERAPTGQPAFWSSDLSDCTLWLSTLLAQPISNPVTCSLRDRPVWLNMAFYCIFYTHPISSALTNHSECREKRNRQTEEWEKSMALMSTLMSKVSVSHSDSLPYNLSSKIPAYLLENWQKHQTVVLYFLSNSELNIG